MTAGIIWQDWLESTEEDGVGSGFAELELVAGIELGGTAGLDLYADARGPATVSGFSWPAYKDHTRCSTYPPVPSCHDKDE